MKKAFSMVEIIIVIIVLGIISSGSYISVKKLYEKAAKIKAINELSFNSTLIVTQISSYLKDRVPSTLIGYDIDNNNFFSIYNLSSRYKIAEWISIANELFNERKYSGFVDFDRCKKEDNMTFSPESDMDSFDVKNYALIFAGSFDAGVGILIPDFKNNFGWHEHNNSLIYEISSNSKDNNIILKTRPQVIYEKYFLVDGAYALARYSDIDKNATCLQNFPIELNDNSLLLFFDYKPWKKETFCADKNGNKKVGKVAILSNEVKGFELEYDGNNLIFSITLERELKGFNKKVTISKRKVIF